MEDMDEFYTEDDREIGIKHCDGFDVYYNFYGEGEYSVDGYWYPTLESAMHPIENRTDKRPMEEMQEKQTVADTENPDDLDKAFMERFEQRMQEEKKIRRKYNYILLLALPIIAAAAWAFTTGHPKCLSVCFVMLMGVMLNHMVLFTSVGAETQKHIIITTLIYLNTNNILTAIRIFIESHNGIIAITAFQTIGFVVFVIYIIWDFHKRMKVHKQRMKELEQRFNELMKADTEKQETSSPENTENEM